MSTNKEGNLGDVTRTDPEAHTIYIGSAPLLSDDRSVTGEFAEIDGESYYCIGNYDGMPPFFISVVSAADHWLFISSTGALTAGRRSPDHPLFPYYTVDKIHDSHDITGSKTLILATRRDRTEGNGSPGDAEDTSWLWEPFSQRYAGLYRLRRSLYKNRLGNIIRFEETNEDLGLTFALTWTTSEKFGFVKRSMLRNDGDNAWEVRILDGIQNIMPYGVPRSMQTERSVLVDAYKKNELVPEVGLGIFRLSAQPVDRPEPSEALKATTVWSAGLDPDAILLSSRQLDLFRTGQPVETEEAVRAHRGAYFLHSRISLKPNDERQWQIVAEIEQDAADVTELVGALDRPSELAAAVDEDVRHASDSLRAIVGSSDGLQLTADNLTTARNYTNVLFNVMRGGVFDDAYHVDLDDLRSFIASFNADVANEHEAAFDHLPERTTIQEILKSARRAGPQLERICHEYLPLIFSRRHGDPSRPWNHFTTDLRAEDGSLRRGYEGNWRDIFQNWEALARSFPEYLESMIAKFVNASTADGYNPYRITNRGIDWEITDPEDPWSFIGYWGDHQIVYLLALLELSQQHHPDRLPQLLARRIFSYANVPYRIKPYADLLDDPHNTIDFDEEEERAIQKRVDTVGADGKLLWRQDEIVLVSLAEKLLVPLLAKLTNFIPGGGIWMNTQRPEWNDANNALVGYGISMVTLYHLRRYLAFLDDLFSRPTEVEVRLSAEVAGLLDAVTNALERLAGRNGSPETDADRKAIVDALGEAGSRYRGLLYANGLSGDERAVALKDVLRLLDSAAHFVDRTIEANRREDGLYHSYNLLSVSDTEITIDHLYPMLEGQAAVLASGILSPEESLELLSALRASSLYRADQHSYILYPNRELPTFLEKNVIPPSAVRDSRLMQRLLADGNRMLVVGDMQGRVHFSGTFRNRRDVAAALDVLSESEYAGLIEQERAQILDVFEAVFDHRSYTGRSGTFFGYEGLGSIYWHMVSKLLLAVQKTVFDASDAGVDPEIVRRLIDAYYDIRAGLGTHKKPDEYGAFPTDPYSHTPAHAGAKQPGMTGQVKEDILCRWGELGVRVADGRIVIDPVLLRASEFLSEPESFEYIGHEGTFRTIDVAPESLAFTYCQTPFIYRLSQRPAIRVVRPDGSVESIGGDTIGREMSAEIFQRTGTVSRVEVNVSPGV
ncbi:MAG: hypothetical protein ACOCTG_00905 [Bacteroidota bacterium]